MGTNGIYLISMLISRLYLKNSENGIYLISMLISRLYFEK